MVNDEPSELYGTEEYAIGYMGFVESKKSRECHQTYPLRASEPFT